MTGRIAAFRLMGTLRCLGGFEVLRDADGEPWQTSVIWQRGYPPVFGYQSVYRAVIAAGENDRWQVELTGHQWRQLAIRDLVVPYSDALAECGDPDIAHHLAARVFQVRQAIEAHLGGNVRQRLAQAATETLTVIVGDDGAIRGCLVGVPPDLNSGAVPGTYMAELMQLPGDARTPLDRLLTGLALRIVRDLRRAAASPAGKKSASDAIQTLPANPDDWLGDWPDAWL